MKSAKGARCVVTPFVVIPAVIGAVALCWLLASLTRAGIQALLSVRNATAPTAGRATRARRKVAIGGSFYYPGRPGKPAEEPAEEARPADEYERLLSYREEMFGKLGFNSFQGAALADANVDWHDADKLLKSGCSHETAVDLLL
jgi:hypothetical protein